MGLRTWIYEKTGIKLKNHPNQPQQESNQIYDLTGKTKEEAFWIQEGEKHIIPNVGHDNPEGFDVAQWLRAAIGKDFPLLEIGCGVGRIASFFKPDEYVGVDINPSAISQAKQTLPDHDFRVIGDGEAFPDANSVLLYTVLLHISDEELEPFLLETSLNKNKIIIAELMDSRWVREGNPPVFNRNPETYILLMQKIGFKFTQYDKKVYEHYNTPAWNVNKDVRITILIFER